MTANLPATPLERSASRQLMVLRGPVWSLRIEGQRVAIVLEGATLPGGAELSELVIHLPHVGFPFDFREGIERFRHHRGFADALEVSVDARILLDWLHRVSGGRLGGTAHDDTLVLAGRTAGGARYTVRARLVADPDPADDEPTLTLSLYQVRVYGQVVEPWPVLASGVIDLLPAHLVLDRTLTTARLRIVRPALAYALSTLGWKLPDVSRLRGRGVELRDGRLVARFVSDDADAGPMLTLDAMGETNLRGAFERFVEDLELKRHHGQVDRLLGARQVREGLAEVYRALDGPPQPGFLAERLVGICASQPILFDEGERVCRDLLRIAPSYEPALCGLASIALGRGRGEEAAVQLERLAAVLTRPGDREDATAADLTVAEILHALAPDEARAALGRVLERSPDHEEALEMLIALHDATGDLRATLPLYKRLLFAARSKDRTREAGLRLARHALTRDQPEDARVFLRVVLEASPDDLEAQLELAEVERQTGHALEAVRLLDAALRQLPPTDVTNSVRVIARLAGLALDPMRDPARARRVLWRAIDLAPIDDAPALELARLAVDAGEPTLGDRYLEFVTADSPHWAAAQALRAESLLARGDERGALTTLLAVLDAVPYDEAALALLERCTPDLGQRELLVHRLSQSAARVAPGRERARVLDRVGGLFASLGLRWDAIPPWEAALDEDPDGPGAPAVATRLFELYAEYGMWPRHQALGRTRLPREHDPEARVALLVRVGRVALRELDDPAEARPLLEEAVQLAPRQREALELLREALEALDQGVALIGVLSRLESLVGDEPYRDGCRMRLAELQLDGLNAPGQARATVGRLSPATAREPRVVALRRRLGLVVEDRPGRLGPDVSPPAAARPGPAARTLVPTPTPRAPAAPVLPHAAAAGPRYVDALALADRGEHDHALALLERVLAANAADVPARELKQILEAQLEGIPRPTAAAPPVAGGVRRASMVNLPAAPDPARSRTSSPAAVHDTREFEAPPARFDAAEPEAPPTRFDLREAGAARPRTDRSATEPEAQPSWFDLHEAGAARPRTDRSATASTAVEAERTESEVTTARTRRPSLDALAQAEIVGPLSASAPAVPEVSVTASAPPAPRLGATWEFEAPALDAADSAEGPRAGVRRPAAGPAVDATLDAKAAEADLIDAAMDLAEGRLRAGDTAGARAALADALAADPDYVPALEVLAEVLRAGADPAERARVLGRLLTTVFDAERSAPYLRELGHVLDDDLGDADAALANFRRYLMWRPLDAEVFERVRRRLAAEGRHAELAELFEKKAEAWEDAEAGGADPLTAWRRAAAALREAAALYLEAGQPALAAEIAARGLALVPDEPELLETLVRACAAASDAAGAGAAMALLAPLLLEGPHKQGLIALVAEVAG